MTLPRKHPGQRSVGPWFDWSPLDLILLRTELSGDQIRLENALNEYDLKGVEVDPVKRKYTEEAIERLGHAQIALSDLESERNMAMWNASSEKAAHARTMMALEKANNEVNRLTREGETMRNHIEKLMNKP